MKSITFTLARKLQFWEIDDNIVIVPILELEDIPKAKRAEMAEIYDQGQKRELELEQ